MLLRAASLWAALASVLGLLAAPLRANVTYILTADYSGLSATGAEGPTAIWPPGSTVNVEFVVPSILTAETTITNFVTASLGPGFSGCGSITQVIIPSPSIGPKTASYASGWDASWSTLCGPDTSFGGATPWFQQLITSPGVYPAFSASTNGVIGALTITSFFNGSVSLGSGVLYLQFPDGTPFGYYTVLTGGWIYHFDLGYEYVDPGNDAANSVYMWDLASGHWWYTNPAEFPYLYDFTLSAWLYYYPSATTGRYTSNPRYFANMTTKQIFAM